MAGHRSNVFFSSVASLYLSLSDTRHRLREFTELVDNNQIFAVQKAGSLHDVVSQIHMYVSSASTRLEGLILLGKLVHQCSTEVFSKNVKTWLSLLLQVLQTDTNTTEQSLACVVMSTVLKHSSQFLQISRDIGTSSTLYQYLKALLAVAPKWPDSALQCICTCIKHFPGACQSSLVCKIQSCLLRKGLRLTGPVKSAANKIEKFLIPLFNKSQNSEWMAKCFALLARCGSGGHNKVKSVENWWNQCMKVLASFHTCLNTMYDSIEPETTYFMPELNFLNDVSDEQPDRYEQLFIQFRNLSHCLESMLSTSFVAPVKVPVTLILQVLCRTMAINAHFLLTRPTTDRVLLAAFIPSLHRCCLSMLTRLIQSCRTLIVPQTQMVNRLLLQTLVWTHTDQSVMGQEKVYGLLREDAYSVIITWLKTLQSSSNMASKAKDLFTEILHDIKPDVKQLKIEIDDGGIGESTFIKRTKRKKMGNYAEMMQGLGTQRKMDCAANAGLVTKALQAFHWLLTCCGTMINPKELSDVQEKLISVARSVQHHQMSPPIPFNNWSCRVELYRVLLSVAMLPHTTRAPPVQSLLVILQKGLQDSSLQVSSFCIEAIVVCELLVHPRAPSFHPPMSRWTDLKPPRNLYNHDSIMMDANSGQENEEYLTMEQSPEAGSSHQADKLFMKAGMRHENMMPQPHEVCELSNSSEDKGDEDSSQQSLDEEDLIEDQTEEIDTSDEEMQDTGAVSHPDMFMELDDDDDDDDDNKLISEEEDYEDEEVLETPSNTQLMISQPVTLADHGEFSKLFMSAASKNSASQALVDSQRSVLHYEHQPETSKKIHSMSPVSLMMKGNNDKSSDIIEIHYDEKCLAPMGSDPTSEESHQVLENATAATQCTSGQLLVPVESLMNNDRGILGHVKIDATPNFVPLHDIEEISKCMDDTEQLLSDPSKMCGPQWTVTAESSQVAMVLPDSEIGVENKQASEVLETSECKVVHSQAALPAKSKQADLEGSKELSEVSEEMPGCTNNSAKDISQKNTRTAVIEDNSDLDSEDCQSTLIQTSAPVQDPPDCLQTMSEAAACGVGNSSDRQTNHEEQRQQETASEVGSAKTRKMPKRNGKRKNGNGSVDAETDEVQDDTNAPNRKIKKKLTAEDDAGTTEGNDVDKILMTFVDAEPDSD